MAKKKKAAKKKTKAKKTRKPAKKSAQKKVTKKKVKKKKTATRKTFPKKKKVAAKSPTKKKAGKAKAKAKKAAASRAKSAPKKTPQPTTKKVQPKKSSSESRKSRAVKRELSRLSPAIHKIRRRLIANRAELLKLIRSSQSVERDAGDLTFSNEIDLASSLEGREMTFQLTSRDRNELKLIEDALFRIANGTYGKCESCEKKISLKRLQIMPLTSLCIECQEATEGI